MKKEEIYLDLSKLTRDEVKNVGEVLNKNNEKVSGYTLIQLEKGITEHILVYLGHWIRNNNSYNRQEVTYNQFLDLFNEKENIINPVDNDKILPKMTKKEPNHYDNSKGSLYQFCEDQKLNSYEFDIIKRVMRCRKKGNFTEDLEKTKFLIDLYLKEFNYEK